MGSPDKIYITLDGDDRWGESEPLAINEEYIRKDALLEKIDDAIAHLSDGSLTGYYESLAYKDIRELINSM